MSCTRWRRTTKANTGFSGSAAHGDYVFGWKDDTLQRAMDQGCNLNLDCPAAGLTAQTPEVYNACKIPQQAPEEVDGCKFPCFRSPWRRVGPLTGLQGCKLSRLAGPSSSNKRASGVVFLSLVSLLSVLPTHPMRSSQSVEGRKGRRRRIWGGREGKEGYF